MAKKAAPKSHHHKHVFWILFASLSTIILVGGNMFLWLSIPMALGENNKMINALVEQRKMKEKIGTTSTAAGEVVYITKSDVPKIWYHGMLFELDNSHTKADGATLSKKALLKLPADSTISSVKNSEDNTLVVFSVLSHINTDFINDPAGSVVGSREDLVSVYAYHVTKNKLEQLFTSKELAGSTYAFPTKISPDNSYIAFQTTQCTDCDAGFPQTVIYDLQKHQLKILGEVLDFEWLEKGNFQYKEFIVEECSGEEIGPGVCFKDPEKLPFKKGSWK